MPLLDDRRLNSSILNQPESADVKQCWAEQTVCVAAHCLNVAGKLNRVAGRWAATFEQWHVVSWHVELWPSAMGIFLRAFAAWRLCVKLPQPTMVYSLCRYPAEPPEAILDRDPPPRTFPPDEPFFGRADSGSRDTSQAVIEPWCVGNETA